MFSLKESKEKVVFEYLERKALALPYFSSLVS